ncbi:hypothetical protein ACIO3S_13270 [Nocardioides sp. NPDC087217]|uniref:hypothetical protein n=1 Tax=Nocardioides sp. NPDC087217 TaxID=3364335 RepID=UPI0037F8CA40
MTALAVLTLVPAVVGVGCCAAGIDRGTRSVDVSALGAMVLMLVAMTDTMLLGMRWGEPVLAPLCWALVLGVLGAALVGTREVHAERLPRGLHLIAMAALTASMGTPAGTHHLHHRPAALPALVVQAVAVSVVAGFVAYAVIESRRDKTPTLARVELGTSSVSLAAMAAMTLL